MTDPINNIQIHIQADAIEVTWDMLTRRDQFLWQHNHLEVRLSTKPALKLAKPSTGSSLDDVQVSTSTSQSGVVTGSAFGVVGAERGFGTETGTTRPAITWGKSGDTYWANITVDLLTVREPDKPFACTLIWSIEGGGKAQAASVEIGYVDKTGFQSEYAKTEAAPTKLAPAPNDNIPLLAIGDNLQHLPIHPSQVMISYHRGTDGIEKLVEDLRKRHFAVWIDKQGINIGDADWQVAIQRGIYTSAGVILCLTDNAASRPVINWEMRTALAMGKPIFPIALENLTDINACLTQLSLPQNLNIEPNLFAKVDTWDAGIDKLVSGLEAAGIRVTDQTKRKDRNTKEYALHQRYLSSIVANARISRLQLGTINPEATDIQGTELERIYVPLPTKETLSIEIQDYRIADWWVDGFQGKKKSHYSSPDKPTDYPMIQRTRPATKSWHDEAGLQQLVDLRQMRLDALHENIETRKARGERHVSGVRNGVYPEELPLFSEDIAAACKRLVLLGGPGSGKSTFVRHLVLCLAGEQLENKTRAIQLQHIPRWTHGALTPIYIELRAFVTSDQFPRSLSEMPTADHLWQYILDCILGNDLAPYAGQLQYDLLHGHALLVLDGLDEVPYPPGKGNLGKRQEQLKALARSLNDTYGQTRILVASRPYAYEGWTLPAFSPVELAPFTDNERQHLAANLYRASGDSDEIAKDKAKRLNTALSDIDPELKDRPLFVTLMATIFAAGEAEDLPTRKGALYRESILLLLERWTKAKPNAKTLTELLGNTVREDLLNRLGQLAYNVHEHYGEQQGTPEIPRQWLNNILFEMQDDDPDMDAHGLRAYLSENAGVLVSPGDKSGQGEFYFAHRTFQEYLAAQHMVSLCRAADSFAHLRDLMGQRPQLWRIPARLVADVLVDDHTFRERDLWDVVDDLLPDDVPDNLDPTDPVCWLIWLGARYVLEQKMHKQTLRRQEARSRDNLRDYLTLHIETPQALPPSERADCGQALGLLGDERDGVGVDGQSGLPDIAWCQVSAGKFRYGENQEERNIPYDYAVSKYLITNAQFKPFVEGDGYTNRTYWTDAGWQQKERENWTEPRYWRDETWNIPNHPVVGVSWYEAYAYTCWLSATLGYAVTLPTEVEWEKAARGTDGREYPWGNDWDANKCNNRVEGHHIDRTSAVGQFPDDKSPYGVLDMSGNVDEWCLTEYKTLSNEAENIVAQPESGTAIWRVMRVLRGGSWDAGNTDDFRTVFRSWEYPYEEVIIRGFRVSRAYT